jgi:DNA-binding NtrC family response regulator
MAAPQAVRKGEDQAEIAKLLDLDRETKHSFKILIIDDERTLRESCQTFLTTEGYGVEVCRRGEEALAILKKRWFDIVLIDQYMSDVPGKELLKVCLERSPNTIAIVMTGNPSVEASLDVLSAGAWDYLPKPFSATQLQILIGRAVHSLLIDREIQERNATTAREYGHSDKVTVLGISSALRRAIDLARRVAQTDASVFLTGESGTGKELIAQFIHHHSRRRRRAMVAINCAALPESLLESEMFGHRKGAFTGAVRDKPGLLEAANGGTMLLDEVTEMSKPIQAKLLRAIQDGVVRRVGSESVDAVVNVRFIASTNRPPEEAADPSVLRHDLYYRLRVVPIEVPALRNRTDDIPLLANHFLHHYWTRHREPDLPPPTLSEEARQYLCCYPWPGNVRELENMIEHAVVLAEPGETIEPSHLPLADHDADRIEHRASSFQSSVDDQPYHTARERVLSEFEQHYLTVLVNRAAGNMSKAARLAGVDRTTLYRLMERHGLQRETIMVGGHSR